MDKKIELERWLDSMLPLDNSYLFQGSSAYLKDIQSLEAMLRPLWGAIPEYFSIDNVNENVEEYITKLVNKVNDNDLPKITTKNRQIVVELGVIAYSLGTYKEKFLNLFSTQGKKNLINWLNTVNKIKLPEGNWYFFLILINSALKINELSYSQEKLSYGLNKINSYYIGNGWYSDGPSKQLDYYVAFAFHFYGIMYSRWISDKDAKEFQRRAVVFANQFQYWFDENGRSIPFGRSLTYRFAHVSFWSAMIVSGLYEETDLSLGQVKGIISRNFDYWKKLPIIQSREHNLTIGYGYAQQLMSEDYNAPGSPMWAFKSFILLELSRNDPFWSTAEEPLNKEKSVIQKEPGFLIETAKNQTTALSVKQFSKNPDLYCSSEKYSKFAYSTYFGFNVSRKNIGINNIAIDSSIGFSVPGHDCFVMKNKTDEDYISKKYAISVWHLWNDVYVKSYLIPLDAGCHIRIHEINNKVALDSVEGSFPLQNWNYKYNLSSITKDKASVSNENGISGIINLGDERVADISKQGPNTNIYTPDPNAIPILKTNLAVGYHVLASVCFGYPLATKNIAKINFKYDDKQFIVAYENEKLIIPRM